MLPSSIAVEHERVEIRERTRIAPLPGSEAREQPRDGEPVSSGRRLRESPPRSVAISTINVVFQTYWSAAGRVWSLQTLAARTTDPIERGVLAELIVGEERRQETARRLLTDNLGIKIGRATAES